MKWEKKWKVQSGKVVVRIGPESPFFTSNPVVDVCEKRESWRSLPVEPGERGGYPLPQRGDDQKGRSARSRHAYVGGDPTSQARRSRRGPPPTRRFGGTYTCSSVRIHRPSSPSSRARPPSWPVENIAARSPPAVECRTRPFCVGRARRQRLSWAWVFDFPSSAAPQTSLRECAARVKPKKKKKKKLPINN